MATAKKSQATEERPAEHLEDAADPMAQAAADSGLAIRGGQVALDLSRVNDLADRIDEIDPQAIKMKVEQIVGQSILVFAWGVRPGNEQYRDENGEIHDYAVIGFVQENDPKQQARVLTTGGARIVPAVMAALARNHPLPTRTKFLSYQAKKGVGYRFARPGE